MQINSYNTLPAAHMERAAAPSAIKGDNHDALPEESFSPGAGEQPSAALQTGTQQSPGEDLVNVDIIYTNDIHGAISPRKEDSESGELKGGVSYLATAVRTIEEESKGNFILVDGGDWGQGSYESTLTRGQTLIDVMNSLHYDAAEVGNHEFDWGRGALKDMIDRAQFPVLGANIKEKGELLPGIRPYTVKDVGGFRFGIMGVISPETPGTVDPKNIKGLEFENPGDAASRYIPEMERGGVDFVLLASHEGLKRDQILAGKFPSIKVIVSGHDHEATQEAIKAGNAVLVETGTGASNVGCLSLAINRATRKIVSCTNKLIPISSKNQAPDPEVEKIIAPVVAEAAAKMNEVVGKTEVDLTHDRKKVLETVMGNVMTDALREATGTDIAMANAGGIRDQIIKGDVTVGDLYRVQPFDKFIVTMDLTGAQIKDLLENSAGRKKGNLHFSGLKVTIDPGKPKGLMTSDIMVNKEPLDINRTYSVTVDDFLAGGANGFGTFTKGKNVVYGGITIDALKAYFEKHTPLTAETARLEGRINFLSPP